MAKILEERANTGVKTETKKKLRGSGCVRNYAIFIMK